MDEICTHVFLLEITIHCPRALVHFTHPSLTKSSSLFIGYGPMDLNYINGPPILDHLVVDLGKIVGQFLDTVCYVI